MLKKKKVLKVKRGKWVKVAQSCPTLWDPMDCSVRGIIQARILECVAIPFSRSLALQVDSLPAESPGKPQKRQKYRQFTKPK